MKTAFAARLTIASLLLTITVGLAPLSAQQPGQPTGATQSSSIQMTGLRDRVTVRRDERGIPYIEAKNDEDLYFAQGYVTASDRLWQMDLWRRLIRGELAEVLGKPVLNQDKLHRTLGFGRIIDATATKLTPEMRTVLEAYARGVNAFIESRTSQNLPPEFLILQYKPKPWLPADSLSVGKLLYEILSDSWKYDVMRAAFAGLPKEKRDALLPEISPLDVLVVGKDRAPKASNFVPTRHGAAFDPALLAQLEELKNAQQSAFQLAGFADHTSGDSSVWTQASNNWVVSGKRTASGKPLLANDPHIPASAPNVWYMTDLRGPNHHVAGVTFPGTPGIVLGHNDHIAWGATNLGPDVQDVYLEKFDKGNPRRYLTPSGWRDAEVRQEPIKVRKGFTDAATETQMHEVTVTRHGPIVLEKGGARYALRWPALDSNVAESEGLFRVNTARNWKEFTAALSKHSGPTQNFIYADTAGHIGYYGAGPIPIRRSGDGSVPYDGSTDDGEWTGFIAFNQLPHQLDPRSGMIITANQRVVGTDYPHFLTHVWAQPYRARQIFELLSSKQKLTANDFRRILGDTYSLAGAIFARETVRTMNAQKMDEKMRAAVNSFAGWDARLDSDSLVAPVVAQMRIAFRQRVLKAALGEELFNGFVWPTSDLLIDRIITEQPREWLPKEFTSYPELLRASYADARQALKKSLGEDEAKWTWGNMSPARFTHPLATAPLVGLQFSIPQFPHSGTPFQLGATVNVGGAVSMRLIADPGDWNKTQLGIPLGESGLPSSPHWKDQLDDWRAVTPRVFPFSEAAIAKATRQSLTMEPKR
jgi:penicillin amidase